MRSVFGEGIVGVAGTASARPVRLEAITGCDVLRECFVAWRLGELSQHSVTPHF